MPSGIHAELHLLSHQILLFDSKPSTTPLSFHQAPVSKQHAVLQMEGLNNPPSVCAKPLSESNHVAAPLLRHELRHSGVGHCQQVFYRDI